MKLERSTKGKHAKGVFFRNVNDIDIFIEDTSIESEKVCTILFSKIFEGKYQIGKVFSLGGKTKVMEECEKRQTREDRIRLYVVDGDLDLLTGAIVPDYKGLLSLARYCVENFLIQENAIAEILDDEELKKSKEQILEEFGFDDWITTNEEILFNLFVEYALVKKHCSNEPTVSYSVHKLAIPKEWGVVDIEKTNLRIETMSTSVINEIGQERYDLEKREIIERAKPFWSSKLIKYVSGKDYILPLAIMRMKKITKFDVNSKVLKVRLAKKADVEELKYAVENLLFTQS